jgi:hypothetical protein
VASFAAFVAGWVLGLIASPLHAVDCLIVILSLFLSFIYIVYVFSFNGCCGTLYVLFLFLKPRVNSCIYIYTHIHFLTEISSQCLFVTSVYRILDPSFVLCRSDFILPHMHALCSVSISL